MHRASMNFHSISDDMSEDEVLMDEVLMNEEIEEFCVWKEEEEESHQQHKQEFDLVSAEMKS
jgi:hypothetical protein